MEKSSFKISIKEKKIIYNILCKGNYSASEKAKKKANVISLYSKGKRVCEITRETGISRRTVYNYLKSHSEQNYNDFLHKKRYKRSSLEEHKENIEELFSEERPGTYRNATKIINNTYDIKISESAVRRFLIKHKIKIKRR